MIPKRNWCRYDGNFISLKNECGQDCKFYRKTGNTEYCGWGENFKILIKEGKLIKCEVKNREPPKNQSINYLEEVIKNDMD